MKLRQATICCNVSDETTAVVCLYDRFEDRCGEETEEEATSERELGALYS